MPYEIACTYGVSPFGVTFSPLDRATSSSRICDLRVAFKPLAYYPAETDIGQGADFDAEIVWIDIREYGEGSANAAGRWRRLAAKDLVAATKFLDSHYRDEMWDEAFAETEAAHYDGSLNRRSAA